MLLGCIGIAAALQFAKVEIPEVSQSGLSQYVQVGLLTLMWMAIVWVLVSAVLQICVALSFLSIDTSSRILRSFLWVASPLVVSTSIRESQVVTTVERSETSSNRTDALVASSVALAGVATLLEVLESRRRNALRTNGLNGVAVNPTAQAQLYEYGLRSGLLHDDRPPEDAVESAANIGAYKGMRIERMLGSVEAPGKPEILIRVMGPVDVVDADGNVIEFQRSKSIELLAWITSHRASARRSIARAAMWDAGVQDATFNNVVSEARRALTAAKNSETTWLSRTYDDHLQLSASVMSDAELLSRAVMNHSARPNELTLNALREALGLVRGLPFAATSYLWPDTEGITTNIVIQILDAAVALAENALERNDLAQVFWATGQGLKVVQGHEGLVAIRMRAHAANRSIAGVESEWRSYLRAVAVDTWSGGRPNPELAKLRETLSYA